MWYPPSTCTISPVVAGNQSDSRARTAFAAARWSVRSQPSGARAAQASSNFSNPGIDLAAIVRSGPAETRFARMPCLPRCMARYRFADSRPALATPIQSYTGHAFVASNVSPTMPAPRSISGRQATASDLYEYVDTCSAVATSSHGASRNPPPRQLGGAYPMECTTPSSPSTCSRTLPGSAARCSSLVTSSSISGASLGSRLAIRSTSDSRPYPVSTTVAPASWASFATANAIDWSVMIPVTSSRLPASSPAMCPPSVPHADAAVDRDDRTGDVRRALAGQPRDGAGHLVRRGEPAGRDLLEVPGLDVLGQHRRHVGLDVPGRHDVRGDAAGTEFPRDRPGQPDQPRLARRVVGLPRRAEVADDRGDEDDPPPAGAQHLRGGPLRDPPGTGEVGLDHPGPLLLGHPQQQRVLGDPGVRDQYLDRPQLRLDGAERGVHLSRVGDVALDAEESFRRAGTAVRHGHLVALLRERLGDGQADPPVTPGDEHGSRHGSPSCDRTVLKETRR